MTSKIATLRTQLSMAMVFTAIISLIIFITGMAIFYTLMTDHWLEGLSESNRATLHSLTEKGDIDPEALITLINAFSLQWSNGYSNIEFIALLGFVAIAILFSTVVGVFVAKRLSSPIEAVTDAALKVSGGALGFQLARRTGASREASDLRKTFNEMTHSLERAEKESKEVTAAIAHELRTPLTVLQGRLQGLKDGVFEPSVDIFDALLGQVETLSHIVDDLGTISRLNSGRFALDLYSVNLADIALQVCTGVAPDLENEGFKIEMHLDTAHIIADPARIRQAMNALLNNSRKYAKSGGLIRVETKQLNNGAQLRVIDEGPGIAVADHKGAFDRWWRADSSRSRVDGGSGLGLSVVQAIADAHGGKASICNGQNQKGLIATMFFPKTPRDIS